MTSAASDAPPSATARHAWVVHLWGPGDGYRYDLEVQLVDDAGAVRDSIHQNVGIRTVEVRGTEFPPGHDAAAARWRHAPGSRSRRSTAGS